MKNILLAFTCALIFTTYSESKGTGNVTGIVYDKATKDILPGAIVSVKGTDIADLSDTSHGAFRLRNIPEGRCIIETKLKGYEIRTDTVFVKASIWTTFYVHLTHTPTTDSNALKSHVDVPKIILIEADTTLPEKYVRKDIIRLKWGNGTGDMSLWMPNPGFMPYNGPNGLAVDNKGNIYIWDRVKYRIVKFSNDGTYISNTILKYDRTEGSYIGNRADLCGISDLGITSDGNYVLYSQSNWDPKTRSFIGLKNGMGYLHVFDRKGKYLYYLNGTNGANVMDYKITKNTKDNHLIVERSENDSIRIYKLLGAKTYNKLAEVKSSQKNYPEIINVDVNGNIYSINDPYGMLKKIKPNGELVAEIQTRDKRFDDVIFYITADGQIYSLRYNIVDDYRKGPVITKWITVKRR